MTEFIANFENRFQSSSWIAAIDFNTFHISGGCIINCLCQQPFLDSVMQEVDVNYHGDSFAGFDDAVAIALERVTSMLSGNNHLGTIFTKKKDGGGVYDVVLPFGVKLRFNFKNVQDMTNPLSYILHGSDLDISQVAYTGQTNYKCRKVSD